jgi:hypothetical protein
MPINPGTFQKRAWAAHVNGDIPRTANVRVAASQTIKRGDMLVFSSGKAAQAITAPAAGATGGTGTLVILGMADADITTTGTVTDADRIPVIIANDDVLFYLPIYAAAAADAEPQDLTFGNAYDLIRWTHATNGASWYAVNAGVADGDSEMVFQGFDEAVTAGEDYAHVPFIVIPAKRAVLAG